MLESQQAPLPIELTYQGRPRTWGFRISTIDVIVLVASTALTIVLWQPTASYSFIGFLVVFHFFLFCNVFRIPRRPELIWGACFLLVCCGCLIADVYSPLTVALSILPITLATIGWSLRLPSYHGVLAKQINPRLDDYLAGR